MIHTVRAYLRQGLIALILTGFLFFVEATVPLIRSINLKGRDFFFRLSPIFFPPPREANQILLVTIDDETLRRLELRWPYSRSLYAELLRRLEPFSPKAVGFDIIFSGADLSTGSDQAFREALESLGNVVIASHESSAGEIGPSSLIREGAWEVGVVDKPRDVDHVIRRVFFSFPKDGERRPSWELALFRKAFPSNGTSSDRQAKGVPVLLRDRFLLRGPKQNLSRPEPVPGHAVREAEVVIDYRLKFDEFPQVSFWRILEGSVLAKEVRNKIVLIGLTAEVFHDIHATPLGLMPGLAINANTLLMLVTGGFFSFVPKWAVVVFPFFSFWLVLLVGLTRTFSRALLITFTLILVYLATGFLLFSLRLVWDPWLMVLGMVATLAGAVMFQQCVWFVANLRLQEESSRDSLTGFYNERFLVLRLEMELNRLSSKHLGTSGEPDLSVIILRLDRFGNGHSSRQEKDRALRAVAEAIHSSVRKDELVCRYGSDQFCIILPNAAVDSARQFGEKVRKLIEKSPPFQYQTSGEASSLHLTVSVGVASVSTVKSTERNKLLRAVLGALRRARFKGGNQVYVFHPS